MVVAEVALVATGGVGVVVNGRILKGALRRHRWLRMVPNARAKLISRRHVRTAAVRLAGSVIAIMLGLTYLSPGPQYLGRRLMVLSIVGTFVLSSILDMIEAGKLRRAPDVRAEVEAEVRTVA